MVPLTVVWVRSPSYFLFGSAKGAIPLSYNARLKMSSDSRPSSDTGRRPTMGNVAGDSSTVPNLTAMKRGQGFRSSFSGRVATVFGCTGSVGRIICNRLGKSGTQMILPYKCDHYEALRLKVTGDLGQVLFHQFDLRDEEGVRTAMKYSDVVINLIGREYETRNFSFDDVHHKGARLLARCAREAGVKNFVHLSHINASENPMTVWSSKGSEFLKSKWAGEIAVMEEFPDATIIRPVETIGHFDWFTGYYCNWWRTGYSRSVPLWRKGKYIVKQPMSYKNLGDAVMAALDNPAAKGMIYEAMGPERFVLADLLDYMHEAMDKVCEEWGYRRPDIRLDFVPVIKAFVKQNIRLGQRYQKGHTLERLERTQLSEESRGLPNVTELGVDLEDIRETLIMTLLPYKAFGYHSYEFEGQRPVVNPLVPLTRFAEARLKHEAELGSTIRGMVGF